MSRIADGLQKARARGDIDPALMPGRLDLFLATDNVPVPWHLEPEGTSPELSFADRTPLECPTEVSNVRPQPPREGPAGPPPGSSCLSTGVGDGSLRQMLSPTFEHSWQEAVAVVQEVASMTRRGLAVPAPEHILLELDGSVTLLSRNDSNEDPVVGLWVLLGWLLEGTEAPDSLRRLAADGARSATASVRQLTRELAVFDSPHRRHLLTALAHRLNPPVPFNAGGIIDQVRRKLSSFLG